MWCLTRLGVSTEVAGMPSLIWNEYGYMIDYETGQTEDIRSVLKDRLSAMEITRSLYSDPIVLGLAGREVRHNAPYDKVDYMFMKYVKGIRWVENVKKFYPVEYIANGVVKQSGIHRTLYFAFKNFRHVSEVEYIEHIKGGFVEIRFDPRVNAFLSKSHVLNRR